MSKINKVVVKGVSYDIEDAYAVRENNLNNLEKELTTRIQGKSGKNNPLDDIVYLGNFDSYNELSKKLETLHSEDPGELWDYCGLFTATIKMSSRVFIMNSCTSFENDVWQQSIIGNVQAVGVKKELDFYSHGMCTVYRNRIHGSWSAWRHINEGITTMTFTPDDSTIELETETEHGNIDYYYISAATTEKAGVMSAEDKKALNDVPKNIAKEKTAIVNGDTIAGLAREVYSRTGKVDTATFLKRTTAGGTTISDGVASIKEIGGNIVKNNNSVKSLLSSVKKVGDIIVTTPNSKNKVQIGVNLTVGNAEYFTTILGHKYYNACLVKTDDADAEVIVGKANTDYNYIAIKADVSKGTNWQFASYIATSSLNESIIHFTIGVNGTTSSPLYVKNILHIDLTEMFGAGKEPSKEECDRLFGNMDALPQGLTIAQPTGLKSVGYNQWNPVNVLRNKSIVENAIEDDVENSHIAVVECLPCKIGEGENNGYVVGYGEGEQWDEDGIEVYFSPLNPMDYIDQDVNLYMHKLEQDATYGTYVPQCKGYLLVVTPTTDKLCVNFHWSGDRSKLDYEEYTESNVALPEIPQMSEWGLAGIQSSGTLVADTIDLDRMVYTKRIGCVNLGSFGWGKNENFEIPRFASIELLNNCVGGRVKNYACAKYPCVTEDGPVTVHILINNSKVIIWDNINTVEELKQNLQGVMLYYELAEPEEYPIVTKTAPNYIGSDYGVEEFTGSKVPLNANILFYMRSLVGETRNFLDRLYDNTDKTDAKEVADYITNGIEGNKELATNAPNLALRALFIAAGAEYNDTDQIIQKTAPWGTEEKWRLEDDGTYTYWEEPAIVEHLPKHYYLNGLGDITEEQMTEIYNQKNEINSLLNSNRGIGVQQSNSVTFIPINRNRVYDSNISLAIDAFKDMPELRVIIFNQYTPFNANSLEYHIRPETAIRVVNNCPQLRVISFVNCDKNLQGASFSIKECPALVYLNIVKLKWKIGLNESPLISKKSILLMIQKAAPTTAITITLHPDAYARIANQADILEALEAQPLITLVSA